MEKLRRHVRYTQKLMLRYSRILTLWCWETNFLSHAYKFCLQACWQTLILLKDLLDWNFLCCFVKYMQRIPPGKVPRILGIVLDWANVSFLSRLTSEMCGLCTAQFQGYHSNFGPCAWAWPALLGEAAVGPSGTSVRLGVGSSWCETWTIFCWLD